MDDLTLQDAIDRGRSPLTLLSRRTKARTP